VRKNATSAETPRAPFAAALASTGGQRQKKGVPVHFKICGITSALDAEMAIDAGASALGLNLIEASPRYVDVETARAIVQKVGRRALTVLVVADQSASAMKQLLAATGAACLQLHGNEAPEVLSEVLPHAYKALRIGSPADVARASDYPGEHLLVDAKVAGMLGGTGKTVDWSLVEPLARARKLTLAGGLGPHNVAQAIAAVRPFCVDVASGVEVPGDPRRKDPALVGAFGRAVMLKPAP
jgi:phosphoribosylanthranilate isomerase